jgi:hypothetical protein
MNRKRVGKQIGWSDPFCLGHRLDSHFWDDQFSSSSDDIYFRDFLLFTPVVDVSSLLDMVWVRLPM